MGKLEQLKEAIKNPPPERLAKIEYQSYILQSLGIIFVSVILIVKGMWYIVFAFIFALGINYSAGMNAYRKYKNIMEFVPKKTPEEIENDISWSRRRDNIIKYVFKKRAYWICVVVSVFVTYLLLHSLSLSIWINIFLYPIVIFITLIFLYFFVGYWIAYPIYKRRKLNGLYKSINSTRY